MYQRDVNPLPSHQAQFRITPRYIDMMQRFTRSVCLDAQHTDFYAAVQCA